MKNHFSITILFFLILFFTSCEKEEDKGCYIFTVTTFTDVLPPPQPGYPKTTVHEDQECDITEEEAKEINGFYELHSIDTIGGFIFIASTSSTFRKK